MWGTTPAGSRSTVPGHCASPGSAPSTLGSVEPSNMTCIPTQMPEHRPAAGQPLLHQPGTADRAQTAHAGVEVAHARHEQPVRRQHRGRVGGQLHLGTDALEHAHARVDVATAVVQHHHTGRHRVLLHLRPQAGVLVHRRVEPRDVLLAGPDQAVAVHVLGSVAAVQQARAGQCQGVAQVRQDPAGVTGGIAQGVHDRARRRAGRRRPCGPGRRDARPPAGPATPRPGAASTPPSAGRRATRAGASSPPRCRRRRTARSWTAAATGPAGPRAPAARRRTARARVRARPAGRRSSRRSGTTCTGTSPRAAHAATGVGTAPRHQHPPPVPGGPPRHRHGSTGCPSRSGCPRRAGPWPRRRAARGRPP